MKFAVFAALLAITQGIHLRDDDGDADTDPAEENAEEEIGDSAEVAIGADNVSSTGVSINILQAGTGSQCQSG